MDFLKQQFDKLLMSALFLIALLVGLHMIHHGTDGASVTWIENIVGQILASLLTLMVAHRIASPSAQNGAAPPAPPSEPSAGK